MTNSGTLSITVLFKKTLSYLTNIPHLSGLESKGQIFPHYSLHSQLQSVLVPLHSDILTSYSFRPHILTLHAMIHFSKSLLVNFYGGVNLPNEPETSIEPNRPRQNEERIRSN